MGKSVPARYSDRIENSMTATSKRRMFTAKLPMRRLADSKHTAVMVHRTAVQSPARMPRVSLPCMSMYVAASLHGRTHKCA